MKKIEFSKTQFKHLLEMAYLGEWLANAHRLHGSRIKKYDDINKYLFSHAASFNLEALTVRDPDSESVYPSAAFESALHEYIEEYDDNTFWNELSDRFATRDLIDQIGLEKIDDMAPAERMNKLSNLDEHYNKIFTTIGLDALSIKEFSPPKS